MRDLLRRLADQPPSDLLVLSIYLDMRPQATGEAPARRSGAVVLKDRLRDIEKTLPPRGPALDSLRADGERITAFLADEHDPATAGLAIFACAGAGLWETVQVGTPFENQVVAGPTPDLYQLARLIDGHETAVVAVVDSNTARLFVTRWGALEPAEARDDDAVHYRKRSMGGWSQARYQRHIDKHRADFAAEAARLIEDVITREGATRLVLAGDEVALTPLTAALSPAATALLESGPRLDIRTPRDDIWAAVAPLLAQAEAADAHALADDVIAAVRADRLGVAGLEATATALAHGQVDVLLLDPAATLDEERRNDLIRAATATGAAVEIVEGHDGLRALTGVGALLRYRHDDGAAGR